MATLFEIVVFAVVIWGITRFVKGKPEDEFTTKYNWREVE